VIEPFVRARRFQGDQVSRLLDNAQNPPVTPGIAADFALVSLGQVEASFTVANVLLYIANGIGQCQGVGLGNSQKMIGQSLGALAADAGQFSQLID